MTLLIGRKEQLIGQVITLVPENTGLNTDFSDILGIQAIITNTDVDGSGNIDEVTIQTADDDSLPLCF